MQGRLNHLWLSAVVPDVLTEIGGLPAHVLLIHVIVVLAPLGAVFTVLSAVWPKARRKLGFLSPLACLIVLVLTPVTTNAGEWLARRLRAGGGPNPAIRHHAELGDTFLWFAIGLFVFSTAVWVLGRLADRPAETTHGTGDETGSEDVESGGGTAVLTRTAPAATRAPAALRYAVAVLAVVVSVATVVQLYRIGDSGASASWDFVKQLPSR